MTTPVTAEASAPLDLDETIASLLEMERGRRRETQFTAVVPPDAGTSFAVIRPAQLWEYSTCGWFVATGCPGALVSWTRAPLPWRDVRAFLTKNGPQLTAFLREPGQPLSRTAFSKLVRNLRGNDQRAVYFIQAAGQGPVKIGVTSDVSSRLSKMQTGSPVPLEIIGVLPGQGQAEEMRLHSLFASHRLHGEWFTPAPELLAYIAEHSSST